MNFTVQHIQFAIFPKNFSISDKIKLATGLREKTGDLFDGEPTILPLPIDAPLEVPRIILQSKDGLSRCNISLRRIDVFLGYKKGVVDNIARAKGITNTITDYFITDCGINIGRIGFVATFLSEFISDANEFIKEKLFNNSKFINQTKIRNISAVINNAFSIEKYDLSRIIKIDTLRKVGIQNSNAILVMSDANTVIEKFSEYNLSLLDINKIIETISLDLVQEKLNDLFERAV